MLRLNIFKQNLINVISQSGLTIDAIYFVMRDTMNEVTDLYNQQLFEDRKKAEVAQKKLESNEENEESSSKAEEVTAANNNEEGTN